MSVFSGRILARYCNEKYGDRRLWKGELEGRLGEVLQKVPNLPDCLHAVAPNVVSSSPTAEEVAAGVEALIDDPQDSSPIYSFPALRPEISQSLVDNKNIIIYGCDKDPYNYRNFNILTAPVLPKVEDFEYPTQIVYLPQHLEFLNDPSGKGQYIDITGHEKDLDFKLTRMLLDADSFFCYDLIADLITFDLYESLIKEEIAVVFKEVLASKYISDELKEIFIKARYYALDILETFKNLIMADHRLTDHLSSSGSLSKKDFMDRLAIITTEGESSLSERAGKEHIAIQNNLEFNIFLGFNRSVSRERDIVDHFDCFFNKSDVADNSKIATSDRFSNFQGDHPLDLFYYDLYIKYLYEGKPVDLEDLKELIAINNAKTLFSFFKFVFLDVSNSIGSLSSQYLKQTLNMSLEDKYVKKSGTLKSEEIDLIVALLMSSTKLGDLNNLVNRSIAKYKYLEPRLKPAILKDSYFTQFIDEAGLPYSTENMNGVTTNQAKQITKIINKLAKSIAALAGVDERGTPGATVAYAMRTFIDDDALIDNIYSLIEPAVSRCYDIVLGEETSD